MSRSLRVDESWWVSGRKMFQAQGTVHAKAQKHKRPWRLCEVEENLVLLKPRARGRELPEEKLELWGPTLQRASPGPLWGLG